jgi:hypothetical protein
VGQLELSPIGAAAAAVVVVCGVAATVWTVQYTSDKTAPPEDCAIVAEIVSQSWEVSAAEEPLYEWATAPPGTVTPDKPRSTTNRRRVSTGS